MLSALYRHGHHGFAGRQRPIGIATALNLCAVVFSPCWITQAQEPVTPAKAGMGGIASAGTFAPVYDSEKRPITAGGFVDKGTVVFEDITKAARPGFVESRHGYPSKEIHSGNGRIRRRTD